MGNRHGGEKFAKDEHKEEKKKKKKEKKAKKGKNKKAKAGSDVDVDPEVSSQFSRADSESTFHSVENLSPYLDASMRSEDFAGSDSGRILSSRDFQDGFSLEACLPADLAAMCSFGADSGRADDDSSSTSGGRGVYHTPLLSSADVRRGIPRSPMAQRQKDSFVEPVPPIPSDFSSNTLSSVSNYQDNISSGGRSSSRTSSSIVDTNAAHCIERLEELERNIERTIIEKFAPLDPAHALRHLDSDEDEEYVSPLQRQTKGDFEPYRDTRSREGSTTPKGVGPGGLHSPSTENSPALARKVSEAYHPNYREGSSTPKGVVHGKWSQSAENSPVIVRKALPDSPLIVRRTPSQSPSVERKFPANATNSQALLMRMPLAEGGIGLKVSPGIQRRALTKASPDREAQGGQSIAPPHVPPKGMTLDMVRRAQVIPKSPIMPRKVYTFQTEPQLQIQQQQKSQHHPSPILAPKQQQQWQPSQPPQSLLVKDLTVPAEESEGKGRPRADQIPPRSPSRSPEVRHRSFGRKTPTTYPSPKSLGRKLMPLEDRAPPRQAPPYQAPHHQAPPNKSLPPPLTPVALHHPLTQIQFCESLKGTPIQQCVVAAQPSTAVVLPSSASTDSLDLESPSGRPRTDDAGEPFHRTEGNVKRDIFSLVQRNAKAAVSPKLQPKRPVKDTSDGPQISQANESPKPIFKSSGLSHLKSSKMTETGIRSKAPVEGAAEKTFGDTMSEDDIKHNTESAVFGLVSPKLKRQIISNTHSPRENDARSPSRAGASTIASPSDSFLTARSDSLSSSGTKSPPCSPPVQRSNIAVLGKGANHSAVSIPGCLSSAESPLSKRAAFAQQKGVSGSSKDDGTIASDIAGGLTYHTHLTSVTPSELANQSELTDKKDPHQTPVYAKIEKPTVGSEASTSSRAPRSLVDRRHFEESAVCFSGPLPREGRSEGCAVGEGEGLGAEKGGWGETSHSTVHLTPTQQQLQARASDAEHQCVGSFITGSTVVSQTAAEKNGKSGTVPAPKHKAQRFDQHQQAERKKRQQQEKGTRCEEEGKDEEGGSGGQGDKRGGGDSKGPQERESYNAERLPKGPASVHPACTECVATVGASGNINASEQAAETSSATAASKTLGHRIREVIKESTYKETFTAELSSSSLDREDVTSHTSDDDSVFSHGGGQDWAKSPQREEDGCTRLWTHSHGRQEDFGHQGEIVSRRNYSPGDRPAFSESQSRAVQKQRSLDKPAVPRKPLGLSGRSVSYDVRGCHQPRDRECRLPPAEDFATPFDTAAIRRIDIDVSVPLPASATYPPCPPASTGGGGSPVHTTHYLFQPTGFRQQQGFGARPEDMNLDSARVPDAAEPCADRLPGCDTATAQDSRGDNTAPIPGDRMLVTGPQCCKETKEFGFEDTDNNDRLLDNNEDKARRNVPEQQILLEKKTRSRQQRARGMTNTQPPGGINSQAREGEAVRGREKGDNSDYSFSPSSSLSTTTQPAVSIKAAKATTTTAVKQHMAATEETRIEQHGFDSREDNGERITDVNAFASAVSGKGSAGSDKADTSKVTAEDHPPSAMGLLLPASKCAAPQTTESAAKTVTALGEVGGLPLAGITQKSDANFPTGQACEDMSFLPETVPPPSPTAMDMLMEEEEEEENDDEQDEYERDENSLKMSQEMQQFGENIVRRLSSLLEQAANSDSDGSAGCDGLTDFNGHLPPTSGTFEPFHSSSTCTAAAAAAAVGSGDVCDRGVREDDSDDLDEEDDDDVSSGCIPSLPALQAKRPRGFGHSLHVPQSPRTRRRKKGQLLLPDQPRQDDEEVLPNPASVTTRRLSPEATAEEEEKEDYFVPVLHEELNTFSSADLPGERMVTSDTTETLSTDHEFTSASSKRESTTSTATDETLTMTRSTTDSAEFEETFVLPASLVFVRSVNDDGHRIGGGMDGVLGGGEGGYSGVYGSARTLGSTDCQAGAGGGGDGGGVVVETGRTVRRPSIPPELFVKPLSCAAAPTAAAASVTAPPYRQAPSCEESSPRGGTHKQLQPRKKRRRHVIGSYDTTPSRREPLPAGVADLPGARFSDDSDDLQQKEEEAELEVRVRAEPLSGSDDLLSDEASDDLSTSTDDVIREGVYHPATFSRSLPEPPVAIATSVDFRSRAYSGGASRRPKPPADRSSDSLENSEDDPPRKRRISSLSSSSSTPTSSQEEVLDEGEREEEREGEEAAQHFRLPEIEETFGQLMGVQTFLEDMEDKTPSAEPVPVFPGGAASGAGHHLKAWHFRRSRTSPARTDRTESDLDAASERPDDECSTDSMYADDEDEGAEHQQHHPHQQQQQLVLQRSYSQEYKGEGGEVLVSCTIYNSATPSTEKEPGEGGGGGVWRGCPKDSDEEFWADPEVAAAEAKYQQLETAADAAGSAFRNARLQMHDIHQHLQDLRRQMELLQDDLTSTSLTLTPEFSLESEHRPVTE